MCAPGRRGAVRGRAGRWARPRRILSRGPGADLGRLERGQPPARADRRRGQARAEPPRRGAGGARARGHAVRRLGRRGDRADLDRGSGPRDRGRAQGRRARARADRGDGRVRVGPGDRADPRRRCRVRHAGRRARDLRLDRVDGARGRPGRDRGGAAALRGGVAAAGQGRPARVGARAPGGDRARQGHPDGASRDRRARRVRAAARPRPGARAAAWSTSRVAVADGHALLPKRS